ncbi:MAG: hypothetical protein ACJA1B_003066 [Polaribacter sp.]|jgi:hypothetical protein
MKKLDKLEISGIIFCVTCLLPMLLAFFSRFNEQRLKFLISQNLNSNLHEFPLLFDRYQ